MGGAALAAENVVITGGPCFNVSDSGAQEPEVLKDVCKIDVLQQEVTPVFLLAMYYDASSCLQ